MTTTGGDDAFMYQTPQGLVDAQAADYEEDSLVLLTKQLQKQNQYIMELTTKIKRLEVDFVKDKQELLESTCKEIYHLRNITKENMLFATWQLLLLSLGVVLSTVFCFLACRGIVKEC